MKLSILLCAITALGLSACVTISTAPTGPAPDPGAVAQAVAAAPAGSMMSLLNAQRAAQGRGAVTEDAALSRAAQAHAQDMVANDYFSHTGLNGSRFTQRAQAAGYRCAIAENIAFGQRSEAEVVSVWMNSDGHRRNILLPNAREYGIGRAGNTWVLMMGSGC